MEESDTCKCNCGSTNSDTSIGNGIFTNGDKLAIIAVCFTHFADAVQIYLPGVLTQIISCQLNINPLQEGSLAAVLYIFYAGGSFLSGITANKFGRRRTILWCLYSSFIVTTISAISPNFVVLLISRGMTGILVGSNYAISNLYLVEIASSTNVKNKGLLFASLSFSAGAGYTSLLAYVMLNTIGWRIFLLICSLPLFLIPLYLMQFHLPESPVYLDLQMKKSEERKSINNDIEIRPNSLSKGMYLEVNNDIEIPKSLSKGMSLEVNDDIEIPPNSLSEGMSLEVNDDIEIQNSLSEGMSLEVNNDIEIPPNSLSKVMSLEVNNDIEIPPNSLSKVMSLKVNDDIEIPPNGLSEGMSLGVNNDIEIPNSLSKGMSLEANDDIEIPNSLYEGMSLGVKLLIAKLSLIYFVNIYQGWGHILFLPSLYRAQNQGHESNADYCNAIYDDQFVKMTIISGLFPLTAKCVGYFIFTSDFVGLVKMMVISSSITALSFGVLYFVHDGISQDATMAMIKAAYALLNITLWYYMTEAFDVEVKATSTTIIEGLSKLGALVGSMTVAFLPNTVVVIVMFTLGVIQMLTTFSLFKKN